MGRTWLVKLKKTLWPFADKLLSDEEKRRIVEAIKRAEGKTSCEIRVHIEHSCPDDPLERAKQVFERLGMTNTKERNGALIYIAPGSRKLAVIGDRGINDRVAPEFWMQIKRRMEEELAQGRFFEGICLGVDLLGEGLKELFPRKPYDVDELSDEISFGDKGQSA